MVRIRRLNVWLSAVIAMIATTALFTYPFIQMALSDGTWARPAYVAIGVVPISIFPLVGTVIFDKFLPNQRPYLGPLFALLIAYILIFFGLWLTQSAPIEEYGETTVYTHAGLNLNAASNPLHYAVALPVMLVSMLAYYALREKR